MSEEQDRMRGRLPSPSSFVPRAPSTPTKPPLCPSRRFLSTTSSSAIRTPSPHFCPLPGTQLPPSSTMTKRFRSTGVYPSPSPELGERTEAFNSKVLQAEERMISRELKTKSEGGGRFIRIVEVSARDGLQNLPGPAVPTELKRELVERLLKAGLRNIEVGSFVRGDWVPQMADTPQLLPLLPPLTGQSLPLPSPPSTRPQTPEESGLGPSSLKHIIDSTLIPSSAGQVHFPVLVPNMKGLENLIKLQEQHSANGGGRLTDEVAVFVSATEAFSQANNHAPLAKILSSLPPVIDKARSLGYRVRGYVSCVITCPYSGSTPPEDVVDVALRLLQMGCYEISLGDTTGEGDPETWGRVWTECEKRGMDMSRVACHDTFSLALSSLLSLLPHNLTSIDSSLAGLGGCPYSPGATGNVPTEDVVYALHKLGYETGIDLDKLVECGNWLSGKLNRRNESRVGRAIWARRQAREVQEKGQGREGLKGGGSGSGEETEDGM
ncbi:hypothetical protein I302_102472 [Kwoniella bestiolae CBS 10118]|uniref:hydroxymethylglutaryl-CoA lyase n=1 Tax=Kwoniella bestiolae CBS 10118 TaxID=1296100 RepID=A0A1B9GEY8_9TREE|nr:hydroxymethylglutaryl-CoA lyase [Kwoniella bestiolae CBS 10118]OCF29652.1 hydroxymethylglutaryl-CoA lyase [Kwoniella bestiolae CBS 10118]